MTARRKKAAPHAAASESVVYTGRIAVGKIEIRRRGEVVAFDADGRSLGTFATDAEAMRAILGRAAGEAKR